MKQRDGSFDVTRFVNPAQVGGIESYTFDDGQARGTRAIWFNTGGGLRFRVLPDRGFDIDQAFFHQHSLAFLTHKGITPPSRAMDHGIDWLKHFPGGLLTSCGPMNYGPPVTEGPWELGLHGSHSNTAGAIESIILPDPHRKEFAMSVTGVVRYGQLFGPNLRLRRTVSTKLGENVIDLHDEFINDANTPCEHAWLLHINFGYPLVDEGAELFHAGIVQPRDDEASKAYFAGDERRVIEAPRKDHLGSGEAVAFVRPIVDRKRASVGIINRALPLGVAIQYDPIQFPRCANWQHLGQGEYVTALEPMTGTLAGRENDRQSGDLIKIPPGGTRRYEYRIAVLSSDHDFNSLSGKTSSRHRTNAASRFRPRR